MGGLTLTPCPINGLFIIEPAVFHDERGSFSETYNSRELEKLGLGMRFVQDNLSRSHRGVLRGLHFQRAKPQGKLVRAARGTLFDVAVDLRRGSRSFGRWFGAELSEENRRQLYIPEGFAHGFLALSDLAELFYKVTDFYDPNDEGGILWNDPALGIEWPLPPGERPILAQKDKSWPPFEAAVGGIFP